MGYVEAFGDVETLFPEAIVLSAPELIKQAGTYLLFDGAKSLSAAEDTLFFSIAIAANSYTKSNGVMQKADDFRRRCIPSTKIKFNDIKALSFENSSLYIVACRVVYNLDFRD